MFHFYLLEYLHLVDSAAGSPITNHIRIYEVPQSSPSLFELLLQETTPKSTLMPFALII